MENNILLIVGAGAIFIALVVLIFLWLRLRKGNLLSTAEKRENFTMEDVIRFFKRPEVSSKLKSDENLLAVVIKENKKNKIHILCCLYDKNKEKTILDQSLLLNILTDKIDEDLIDQFGDKDMIVLQ